MSDKVEVQNVNHPEWRGNVDRAKYEAMKSAFLEALPRQSPGATQSEIRSLVQPHLDQQLFPQGAKSGWWAKTVQLDLEAKDVMIREATKPLRWYLSD